MIETETKQNGPAKKVDPYLLRLHLEARSNLGIITTEETQQLQGLVGRIGPEVYMPDKATIKTGISVPAQDNMGPKPRESFMKAPSGQTPKNPL